MCRRRAKLRNDSLRNENGAWIGLFLANLAQGSSVCFTLTVDKNKLLDFDKLAEIRSAYSRNLIWTRFLQCADQIVYFV